MTGLVILLRVVEVLVCVLLVGVILLQRSKGSGAGVSFGGGMGEAIFGAQMGDVLTRTTVILGIVFLVNTLVLSILAGRVTRASRLDDSLMSGEQPPVPATAPMVPGRGDGEMAPPAGLPEDAVRVLDEGDRAKIPEPIQGTEPQTVAEEPVAVP